VCLNNIVFDFAIERRETYVCRIKITSYQLQVTKHKTMKQKSRKLLSRLGAAFMLGLSMFNFGAAWNKMRGGEMPRKARNIRKRTQEDLDQDVKEIASIAEEEAQVVLASKQIKQQESQQQLQAETMSITQKAFRYAAVSVWVASAGLIFSSAIFNYPFALGKGMLSLLPGIPHMAALRLETDSNFYEVGEEIPVKVILDSGGDNVKAALLLIRYDSAQLDFEKFELNRQLFDVSKDFLSDSERGVISVALENSLQEVVARKDSVATFVFSAKQEGLSTISLDQKDSLILKKTKAGEYANVLGKVSEVQPRIVSAKDQELFCLKTENFGEDGWERIAEGGILPSETSRWNEINSDWGFVCSYDEFGILYILISGPNDGLKNIQLEVDEKDSNMTFGVAKKWQQGDSHFFGTTLTGGDIERIRSLGNVSLKIDLQDQQLKWPKKGHADLVLQ
jgi:hypothetical protein